MWDLNGFALWLRISSRERRNIIIFITIGFLRVVIDDFFFVKTIKKTDVLTFKQPSSKMLRIPLIILLIKRQWTQHYWHLGLQCQLFLWEQKKIPSTLSELYNPVELMTTTLTFSTIMNIKGFYLLQPQEICLHCWWRTFFYFYFSVHYAEFITTYK